MAAVSSAAGRGDRAAMVAMVEGAPDHGRDLCHLLDGVQAVEPRHQRIVQEVGIASALNGPSSR